MNVPNDRRYTDSHEWIRTESDGTVTIGYSSAQLKEIVDKSETTDSAPAPTSGQ